MIFWLKWHNDIRLRAVDSIGVWKWRNIICVAVIIPILLSHFSLLYYSSLCRQCSLDCPDPGCDLPSGDDGSATVSSIGLSINHGKYKWISDVTVTHIGRHQSMDRHLEHPTVQSGPATWYSIPWYPLCLWPTGVHINIIINTDFHVVVFYHCCQ